MTLSSLSQPSPGPFAALDVPIRPQTLQIILSVGAALNTRAIFHKDAAPAPGSASLSTVRVDNVTVMSDVSLHDAAEKLVSRLRATTRYAQPLNRMSSPEALDALARSGAPQNWAGASVALNLAMRRPQTVVLYRPGHPSPWCTHAGGADGTFISFAEAVDHLALHRP